ncbi:MAG TPA: CpsD/CapB family tyrosine-protein kinase [Bryobacteraceae bacterium]|nr:CpsD/CapB family tyrosine-protein kinase [Bryobacteraceae bacterium]
MSKVHEALRRAEMAGALRPPAAPAAARPVATPPPPPPDGRSYYRSNGAPSTGTLSMQEVLARVEEVPFQPLADAHLLDATRPSEAPAEEFRTLRTRLNHLQSLSPIRNIVVTSPSPAEGKSFTAVNLALAEAQLSGNLTLLADFDFRRPIVHSMFQVDRSPGITDYLMGKAELHQIIKKVAGTNLYIMPAGEAVLNPLELLNLNDVKVLLDLLPTVFNWVILDTPPLLFAADASLLSTLCHGTVLVVRIGTTTIDSVTRAMQSLCENNVLGIAVNGARRGELYSKYTYYHSYYYAAENARKDGQDEEPGPLQG